MWSGEKRSLGFIFLSDDEAVDALRNENVTRTKSRWFQTIGSDEDMDLAKRDALVAKIGDLENCPESGRIVGLEEFFHGNDDGASIWCNLLEPYEPDEIFRKLAAIRERDDVSGVLVMVTQFDGGDDEWPFSDTILFVTSGEPDEVKSWLGERAAPDEIWTEPVPDEFGVDSMPEGHQVVRAWWD